MTKKIGVGIIGASPLSPGWAVAAHLPALQASTHFELRAVSTSRAESAEAAATAYGVPAYDSYEPLIAHPAVELVVIAVNAPDHRAPVLDAINSGKIVFCEWPLASNLDIAEELADRAAAAKVRTVIGLQARYAPAVQKARSLVVDGYIGKVLGTTLVLSGMAWADQAKRSQIYWFDAAGGVNALSVPTLHALDAVNFVLGDFASVTAESGVRRSKVRVMEDGTFHRVTAPDHIAISGTLRDGAIFSSFTRGHSSRGENLRWEINGDEGDLVITATYGNMQVADLALSGARGDKLSVAPIALTEVESPLPTGMRGSFAANVFLEYEALARDFRDHTSLVPGFDYARNRHRLLAAIETAAHTGVRRRFIEDDSPAES